MRNIFYPNLKKLGFFIFLFFALASFERVVTNNDIELWTETFGEKSKPTILLIMGAGASGICWPDSMCEKLSSKGYFVIRYDHRDVGKSSLIDYKKDSYTLDNLAGDALAILDAYQIKKAHIVGMSMGGFIGQILAIDHPERLYSLVSLMSSPDGSVTMASAQGKDTSSYALPPPAPEAVKAWSQMKLVPVKTKEDRISSSLMNWKLCAGSLAYNEQEFRKLEERVFERTKSYEALFNHWPAMSVRANRTSELQKVKVPTLVIHGDCDVVLPVEHGKATARAIPGSKLVVIPGMGHAIGEFYSEKIASLILSHVE